jgi:hypothetical protein
MDRKFNLVKIKNSLLFKILFLSHHNGLRRRDFLIDDREKDGANDFAGNEYILTLINFLIRIQ